MAKRDWCVVLSFVLGAWGCDAPPPEATAGPGSAPAEAGPPVLRLAPEAVANARLDLVEAGPAEVTLALELPAEVRLIPERLASVSAGVKGVVKRVDKKLGETVKKGELLAILDSRELTEAKVAYFESEHKIEFAEKALERERALHAKGLTPKEELQKREHEVEEAGLAHAAALQRLKLLGFAEDRLHELQKDLSNDLTRFSLRSPFAGEIIRKQITLGETVEAERELFAVADFSVVMLEVKVPMEQVGALQPGLAVRAECEKLGVEAEGRLSFISPMADSATRTVAAQAEIPNPKGDWRPGMAARLRLNAAPRALPVAVPRGAVQELEGRPHVFVVLEPGAYELRPVELGVGDEARVEVTRGLAPGERVVSGNALQLKTEWQNRGGH